MNSVLLVDDDSDLRVLLRMALLDRDIEVLEADSATDAESILASRAVDIVVVDCLLPNQTGITLVKTLRGRDPSLRVVFMAGFFRDLDWLQQLATDLDVSLVLYKPIEPTAFADGIAAVLGESGPEKPRQIEVQPDELSLLAFDLAELGREFGEKLPGRLDELGKALLSLKNGDGEFEEARLLAHRLRGSCGSFGFAAVGLVVGNLEDLLVQARGEGTFRPFFWADAESLLRDALKAVAQERTLEMEGWGGLASSSRPLLVVDDDPDFVRVIRALGKRLSVSVITAHTAEEAAEQARSHSLLAAVLDVHLRGGNSYQIARKIRETADNEAIPIAFASVDGSIETRLAAIEAGGTRFFDKPISDASFTELLQQFLSLSSHRSARVMVVDDDPDIVVSYSRYLRSAGYVTEHLVSPKDIVQKLEEVRPDALLLDVVLPRVSGIDVCRALRDSDRWSFLPILIMTAQLDSATRLRAFRAGASDVVGKPVLPEELLARVGVQVERARLLRERSDRDALSGLMLRRAFMDSLQRAMASCARDGKPLALVLIDLDQFKMVNDRHGHLSGDRVIAAFGELLRQRFRVEDLRGRWGGEEFILVFAGQTVDFAVRATRRVLAEFSGRQFASANGGTFSVTFSAGVAGYPDDGLTLEALIRKADEMLYLGKSAGRNQVQGTSGV